MKNKYDGWCLKNPKGKLLTETFAATKDDCWMASFEMSMTPKFQTDYWKKWVESRRAAERLGFIMVRCVIKEAKW
jgi:hypothetical protein